MTMTRPLGTVALLAASFLIATPAQAQIRRSSPAPSGTPAESPVAVPAPAAPAATPAKSAAPGTDGLVMSGKVARESAEEAPASGGLNLGWPPKLPPFFWLEVMAGTRNQQNVENKFPSFENASFTVPGLNTSITAPNIRDPKLATQISSGASLNTLKAELGFLIFSGGLEAAGMRVAPTNFGASSVASSLPVPGPLLSQGYTGFYGKALGLRAGYRRETYRGLPGVPADKDVSLNEFLVGYGLGLGLGPVSGGVDLLGGIAPLTVADGAASAATLVPAEAEVALGLTLYGVKVKFGQRLRLTGYGSDFGAAFGSLLSAGLPGTVDPTSILNGSVPANVKADLEAKAITLQDSFRVTFESGPFIEAGVSF
ncbi:MAG: hypothetical protein VKO64_02725 [Candidatus Sericytochromatia bacterium]|nr:hypothetical protein [Candidatus Sericytochromatia bacterium]